MRVEHPRRRPPAAVDVNGASVSVDGDGTFEVPDDAHSWLERFAAAYDVEPDDLLVGGDDTGPDYTSIPPNPDDMTYDELYAVATDLGVEGRSSMDKGELIEALRSRG